MAAVGRWGGEGGGWGSPVSHLEHPVARVGHGRAGVQGNAVESVFPSTSFSDTGKNLALRAGEGACTAAAEQLTTRHAHVHRGGGPPRTAPSHPHPRVNKTPLQWRICGSAPTREAAGARGGSSTARRTHSRKGPRTPTPPRHTPAGHHPYRCCLSQTVVHRPCYCKGLSRVGVAHHRQRAGGVVGRRALLVRIVLHRARRRLRHQQPATASSGCNQTM